MQSTVVKETCAKGDEKRNDHFESPQILTVRQFCTRFPWPSESAMRSYIYRAKELGFSEAFIRVNRRVLINSRKFFEIIDQHQSRSNSGGLYETAQCPEKGKNHF